MSILSNSIENDVKYMLKFFNTKAQSFISFDSYIMNMKLISINITPITKRKTVFVGHFSIGDIFNTYFFMFELIHKKTMWAVNAI